jgi:hypothetical protein
VFWAEASAGDLDPPVAIAMGVQLAVLGRKYRSPKEVTTWGSSGAEELFEITETVGAS